MLYAGVRHPELILNLSDKKIENQEYLSNLVALKQNGAVMNWNLQDSLTLEKGSNTDYIRGLIRFKEFGLPLNHTLIDGISIKKALNPTYFEALKKFQNAGIEIDLLFINSFTMANAENEAYVNAIIDLQNSGLEVDYNLKNLDLKKVPLIKKLLASGVKLTSSSIDYLDEEIMAKFTDEFAAGILDLINNGAEVNLPFVRYMKPENLQDPDYVDGIKKLLDLGIKVDPSFLIWGEPEDFKALDDTAMNKLRKLQDRAIPIDPSLIDKVAEGLHNKIDEKYEAGELPPDIRPSFVKSLIENNKCICGRKINHDNTVKSMLVKLGNIQDLSEIEGLVSSLKSQLQVMEQTIPNSLNNLDVSIQSLIIKRNLHRGLSDQIENINISPNPLTTTATFTLPLTPNQSAEFRLYSLSGKMLRQERFTGNSYQLNRGQLPAGMYIYSITGSAQNFVGKLMVE